RRWMRDLRLHVAESRTAGARTDPEPALSSRAALTSLARAELRTFLKSGQRLDFSASARPRISVIVVLYNRAELTLRCLQALARERVPFELLLVDNASTDETTAVLERISGAEVLRQRENIGFLRAVNEAARRARGDYLLLLNNDAEPCADALSFALA